MLLNLEKLADKLIKMSFILLSIFFVISCNLGLQKDNYYFTILLNSKQFSSKEKAEAIDYFIRNSKATYIFLMKKLDEEDDAQKAVAAFLLGRQKNNKARLKLEKLLQDSNSPPLIVATAEALGEIGDINSAKVLIDKLKNSAPDYQYPIISALIALKGELLPVIEKVLEDREFANSKGLLLWILAEKKEEKASYLFLKYLSSLDPKILVASLHGVANLRLTQAISQVTKLLSSSNPEICSQAIMTAEALGSPQLLKPLHALLSHADPMIRSLAVEAIGIIGKEQVVPELSKFLNDEDFFVRAYAIHTLAKIGTPQTLKLINERLFQEEEPALQIAIIEELMPRGVLKDKKALLNLFKNSKDLKAQLWIAAALVNTGEENFKDFIYSKINNPKEDVKKVTLTIIKTLGDKNAIPYLKKALEKETNESIRYYINNVIQDLSLQK